MDLLIVLIRLTTELVGLAGKVLKLVDARREGRDDNGEPRAKPKAPRHLGK
jgi:hypothetical protein